MGKTVRSWQKRSGWQVNRHQEQRKRHFGKSNDKFRFGPRQDYK